MKKGAPPSICASPATASAARCISTSAGVANWGMRVSSFVDTSTVRVRLGSTWGRREGSDTVLVDLSVSLWASRQRQQKALGSKLPFVLAESCCLQSLQHTAQSVSQGGEGTHLHHGAARRRIVPVAGVLQAQDDVLQTGDSACMCTQGDRRRRQPSLKHVTA